MNLPVSVTGPGGKKFKGVIYDISPDGVQLRFAISEGEKLYPDGGTHEDDMQAMQSTLRFDLAYRKTVDHVVINAHPAYFRALDDDARATGMFFGEENLAENKKISDFLFYQLQLSYADIEQKKIDQREDEEAADPGIKQTIIETRVHTDGPLPEKFISEELENLILQLDYPKEHLEPLKEIMYRVMTNLKVIQELTRHIDERINLIEHKISRGVGPR